MLLDNLRLVDVFLPLFIIGLFALAAILRIKKSLRFLQRSSNSDGKRLLHKFYIFSSIVLFIATIIVFMLVIGSIM